MKSKTKFLNFIKILFALILTHCSETKNVIDISQGWELRIGYETKYFSLDPEINSPKLWESVDLPNNLTKHLELKNYSGYITLRRQIPNEIISSLNETDSLALDVGRVLDVSRYFINGKYFASMG
ncbi:MAG: hypothetical protein N3A69_18460, partial [Leptospiraceae bacterium]|nr:hypothetical protein [Leptospiraceae bacterium]